MACAASDWRSSGPVVAVSHDGLSQSAPALLGIPLIVIVARFPLVVDNRDGGIEVGFDSCVLMFLLCTLDAHDALFVWSLGVMVTQLTTGKRWSSKAFNIGVGIIAGSSCRRRRDARSAATHVGTPRELVAVMLAAVAYFATDYVMSAVSVAISSGTGVRRHLLQRGTLLAVACFVPFDTLGYLGVVVHRADAGMDADPARRTAGTLLVATRAVTRGRENARRLTVLFDAAVRAQTLSDARAGRGRVGRRRARAAAPPAGRDPLRRPPEPRRDRRAGPGRWTSRAGWWRRRWGAHGRRSPRTSRR